MQVDKHSRQVLSTWAEGLSFAEEYSSRAGLQRAQPAQALPHSRDGRARLSRRAPPRHRAARGPTDVARRDDASATPVAVR
eukprot:4729044-Pleurochrysis_carterae.AAC.4